MLQDQRHPNKNILSYLDQTPKTFLILNYLNYDKLRRVIVLHYNILRSPQWWVISSPFYFKDLKKIASLNEQFLLRIPHLAGLVVLGR